MAKIFIAEGTKKTALLWFHDLCEFLGVIPGYSQKYNRSNIFDNYNSQMTRSSAQEIYDELLNRNFSNIDNAIRNIADIPVHGYKQLGIETVTKIIVYMADQLNLFWDDTIRTPFEIEEFKKTLLGQAVYKYNMALSCIRTTKKTANNSTSGGAQRVQPQAPKNNYKQSGPQSANVRDLKGPVGQKVVSDTGLIYKIIADKSGKNTPRAFIKPLSASGALGSTNRVFISSGNGYTDCTCYFDELSDADTFLSKLIQSGKVPVNINNLRIVKSKADPNGYFLVGTEFGDCAISAKTLNEALKEAVEEPTERPFSWEKATENYSREELEELHRWMRQD